MTTLRGPDPYAQVEDELAQLMPGARQPAELRASLCGALQTIPTYTWVAYYPVGPHALGRDCSAGERALAPRTLPLLPGTAPVIANDLATAAARYPFADSTRATAQFPCLHAGQVVGVLVVASVHRGAFGPADVALLTQAAQQLGALQ